MKRRAILLLMLAITWSLLHGLDPHIPLNQYLTDRWDQTSGLPANGVKMVVQTPDGYIWLATTRGLARFDGKTFSLINYSAKPTEEPSQPGDIPDALHVDRSGLLWIGGGVGLTVHNYRNGSFTTYTSADGLTSSRVRRISDDMRGNLWISFFTGYVNRFANGVFKAYNEKNGLLGQKINAILEDCKGGLIFATREEGFFSFRDEQFYRVPIPNLENVQVIHIFEDHLGKLWIGTSKGLFRFGDNKLERFSWENGLSNEYITVIFEDSDHNLWVGTVKGLNRLKPLQDSPVQFESTLEDSMITWVMEDTEKSLWVSTYETGVRCLKEPKFFPFTPQNGKTSSANGCIWEDNAGHLWIGAVNGEVFHYSPDETVEKLYFRELADTGVIQLASDSMGRLWMATNGKGVFFSNNAPSAGLLQPPLQNLTKEQGLSDNLVTCILEDKQKRIWLGAFDGVSCYENGRLTSLTSHHGLTAKTVYRVFQDSSDRIWFAADKGAYILEKGEFSPNAVKHVIKDIPVTSVYEDREKGKSGQSVFWLTTNGSGLKRMENDKILSFTTAEGLASDFLQQLLDDDRGSFWITSNRGILQIKKELLNHYRADNTEPIHCTLFDIADGMQNMDYFNEFSFALKRRNGQLLFASQNSLSILDPEKIRVNKLPPPVIIESVHNGETPIPLQDNTAAAKGVTALIIRFTAPSFLAPEKIKFRYMLEGVDRNWIYLKPGKAREAYYNKLPPGRYRFRASACNREGVWNRDGDGIFIHLKPYFYESILFKILISLLLAAAGTAGFFFYKNKVLAKKARYKNTPLNPRFADELITKLKTLMEKDKIYCDPELSLQNLADRLSITPHILSQLLNENLNRNFSDYINQFRIEEAKIILRGAHGEDKKIITVAFDVGFNTKVAFYNAFKKFAGMTPSEYKKK